MYSADSLTTQYITDPIAVVAHSASSLKISSELTL